MTSTPPPHPRSGEVVVDVVWGPVGPRPPLPVAELSRAEKAAELARLQGERAARAAYEAELICALADDTPELPGDHPAAGGGSWSPNAELPGVDESFVPELSMVLNCGRRSASIRAQRAWTWREKLPATRAALSAGRLDEPRARLLADLLQAVAPGLAGRVEAAVLPEAADLSLGRLRRRVTALLLELDAAAVDGLRAEAQRRADVRLYPSVQDGMATLAAELPAPEAAQCFDVLDQLATMLEQDGDPRPIGRLRVQVLSDLIRRPWLTELPEVAARLHVFAALDALEGTSTEAGEVNGLAVTAGHLRALCTRIGALGLQTPEAGTLTVGVTGPDGALLATATVSEAQRIARRGCPQHPGEACSCPVLGMPPGTEAYEPTTAQRVWVKTRDRTCRFPNCGQRVGWADLDHVLAHARGGQTTCTNLCCLCRSHHRIKTRDPSWHFTMSDDGTLTVTTPSGITRTTRPPELRARTTAPCADAGPPAGTGSSPAAEGPVDEPPPY